MVPNSHLPRLGFINIMMRSDFVAPTVRGIRKMWHREVFGDMIAQALNICVRHRATAAHLLDIVHELEGFKVRY